MRAHGDVMAPLPEKSSGGDPQMAPIQGMLIHPRPNSDPPRRCADEPQGGRACRPVPGTITSASARWWVSDLGLRLASIPRRSRREFSLPVLLITGAAGNRRADRAVNACGDRPPPRTRRRNAPAERPQSARIEPVRSDHDAIDCTVHDHGPVKNCSSKLSKYMG